MQVSLREAASLIGHRSRSTLYRWISEGLLHHGGYLRGHEGAWRIETHPPERMPFVSWAEAVCGNQGPRRQSEQEPPPPEWADRFRVADPSEPPLSREEIWREVGRLMRTELCEDWQPPEMPLHLETLVMAGLDCLQLVQEGARWCPDKWRRYEIGLHLEFAHDEDSQTVLREMLAAGKVPADLVPDVEAALSEA